MQKTRIRWTNYSSNPIRARRKDNNLRGWACTRVSEECRDCYAATINRRLGTGYDYTLDNIDKIEFVLVEKEFAAWAGLKDPSKIFVCDMLDLFHENMPGEFIQQVFDNMLKNHQHTFQVLTKRPGIMERFVKDKGLEPSNNIWLGTSVGIRKALPRIDVLRRIPWGIKFLSIEPLLEDIAPLDLTGISWVIVGGESGPTHRPMDHQWAVKIRDECRRQNVAFFFKQSAGLHPDTGIKLMTDPMYPMGEIYEEFP